MCSHGLDLVYEFFDTCFNPARRIEIWRAMSQLNEMIVMNSYTFLIKNVSIKKNHCNNTVIDPPHTQISSYSAVLSVCFVSKYRFCCRAGAFSLTERSCRLFSPCFTEQKLWSWSSWRPFVS